MWCWWPTDLRCSVRPNPSYEDHGNGLYVYAATGLAGQIAKGDLATSLADAKLAAATNSPRQGGEATVDDFTDRKKIEATLGPLRIITTTMLDKQGCHVGRAQSVQRRS